MWARRLVYAAGGGLALYAMLVLMDRYAFIRWDPVAAAYRVLGHSQQSTDTEG